MGQVNVAVVGFGQHFARHHLPLIATNPNVEIIAIGEVLSEQQAWVNDQLSKYQIEAPIYTTTQDRVPEDERCLTEMLANHGQQIDAVFVSTPHTKHYREVKAFLMAGAHVIVDKPLALTYAEAQDLVKIAESEKLDLIVSSQRRYERVYDYTKQIINSGGLGRIFQINGLISAPFNHLNGWWSDPSLAGNGGVLWNLAWHMVDIVVYLTESRATVVSAKLSMDEKGRIESCASSLVQFDSELDFVLTANVSSPLGSAYERLQIWGTHGMMVLDRFKPKHDKEPAKVTLQKIDGSLIEDDLTDATAKAWAPSEVFLELLTAKDENKRNSVKRRILSSGAQSLETVKIIDGMYLSGRTGNQIRF